MTSHPQGIENKAWFSVPEAAFLLGVTERAIQLRAKKGTLAKKKSRSQETGRMRLMVTSPELVEKAVQAPVAAATAISAKQDYIPRFSSQLGDDTSVGASEFAALTAQLQALDNGLEKDRVRLEDLESQRDRLAQALAKVKAELNTERTTSHRHENSLHRFIDRQEVRHRTRETQLVHQVSRIARALGRAEHHIAEIKAKPAWWRQLGTMVLKPFLPRRRESEPVTEA